MGCHVAKTSNRTYTVEFKKQAISLALRSDAISDTAKRLGIPEGTLATWIRKSKIDGQQHNTKTVNLVEELHKLRKENARLREEKEILKKAATYFARESEKERFFYSFFYDRHGLVTGE